MFTLWILIFGFANAGGTVTPYAKPVLRAMATYHALKECDAAAAELNGLQSKGLIGSTICLPTGISDPVTKMALPRRAPRTAPNSN